MRQFGDTFSRFIRDEQGTNAIEYGLMAALIAVTALVGITLLGGGVSGLFGSISTKAGNAMSGG
jgi:pilus assembly protein Flp/PilA